MRSNFAYETPLTDHDDRVKLWGFWLSLGLAIAIVFVALRVAFVVSSGPSAPVAANHAAGVSFMREARP